MWTKLEGVCFSDLGWPYGLTHVAHFDSLSKPLLREDVRDRLTVAYVYLATTFFCLDHLYDSESHNDFEIPAIALLSSKALERICNTLSTEDIDSLPALGETSQLFTKFTSAMLLERQMKTQHNIREACSERDHIIGRSWLVIFMYRIIQKMKRMPADTITQNILEDMVYFFQLGDDWGDWRDDYRAGNLTPFLRRCIKEMGKQPRDEHELERYIYLSGAYEKEGLMVYDGLKGIERRLVHRYGEGTTGLRTMVAHCGSLAESVVRNFERVKAGVPAEPLAGGIH